MKQYHTDIIYYSPTGTSKRVAMAFAEGLDKAGASFPGTRQTDLTTDFSEDPVPLGDSLVVAAAPVYGGRLAETAVKRFSRLKGSGTPAVAIVLYGNRDYEDALVELQDLLEDAGFKVVAAAAFIGEHSYSRPAMPVAEGRPDSADIASAVKFGEGRGSQTVFLSRLRTSVRQGQPSVQDKGTACAAGSCMRQQSVYRMRNLRVFLPGRGCEGVVRRGGG